MYQNPYMIQPYQQQVQPTYGINWVQGINGAKAYLVAPGNTVQLWDSESQTIYLKSADASGLPSIKILDYTIRDSGPVQQTDNTYALKGDLEALNAQVASLRTELENYIKGVNKNE